MSLILEALRRSEAERRRGQAPSLLDGPLPPRTAARPLWPVALAGLFGGLLLAAGLVWWLQPVPPVDALAPPPIAPAAPATPAPPAPTAPTAPPATPALSTPSAAPVAPAAPAPPVPSPMPEPRPAPPVAAAPEPPVDAPAVEPALPPLADMAAAAPIPPPAADPHLGPAAGDLPVGDLAAPLRAGLPPLRLSMHVFAEDPARRFAIVDGTRLREGEALADGLQLLEIRRDGLRLAWQGRVLWLPR